MEKQEVINILWHWGESDKRIKGLITKKRLAEYRINDLYDIGGTQRLDGMPHGTSNASPVESEYERIEKLKGLFKEEISGCLDMIERIQRFKMDVDGFMDTMRYRERTVVTLKYREHVTVTDIAKRMNVSRRTVNNIEARAIRYLMPRMNVQIPAQ